MHRNHVLNLDEDQPKRVEVEAEYLPSEGLLSSTSQIWKSKIGWRITFVVFMTIVIVYSAVLLFILSDHHASKIKSLEEQAVATIAPLVDIPQDKSERQPSPFTNDEMIRLFGTSKVLGVSLYDERLRFIKDYGEKVTLIPENYEDLNQSRRTDQGNGYEFFLKPGDLVAPYYLSVKMDASDVSRSMNVLLVQNIGIAFLLSFLVTNVLMITLGRWLLSPILTLRQNLIMARKNPERPYIQKLNISPDSEIGAAIEASETLILQNARNLKQVKTKAEGEIHRLAYYDTLTGLPNRELFHKVLRDKTKEDQTNSDRRPRMAVIAIDLDHFKDINDSMGHHIGDIILKAVGQRLVEALPENTLVSRYGEDQFAILSPISNEKNKAMELARRLSSVIRSEPIKAFDEDFQVRCSMGVAVFPDDSTDADHIMKGADIALNRAKEDGRDTIRTYSRDFDIAVKERFETLRDLRVAMSQDQLRLFYQPQFELKTGKLVGVECLIRWWKPDESGEGGTFVPPGAFIPIAENSGLIIPMGEWIISHACERGMAWREMGLPPIRIAVNVSGAQFMEGNLISHVKQTLNETRFPAEYLELEVTESLFMADIDHTINVLHQFHKIGLELAIDDFGTGYSSLSYLRQFPIDRLKIDRSFVDSAVSDEDDAAIARTIIALGRSLNLEVIGEGVETKEQQEFLINEGCDMVQGFRYAKPMQEHELIEFMQNYTNSLSYFDDRP